MTAAAHALGRSAPIRRPRVDTVDVCPKPITRQDQARRLMLKVAAGFAGLVLVATGQQIATYGWRAFVFRAPGVGGTPATAVVSSGGGNVAPAAMSHGGRSSPPRGPSRGAGMATMTRSSGVGGTGPVHGVAFSGVPAHDGSADPRPPVIYVPAQTPRPGEPPTDLPTSAPSTPPSSSPPDALAPTSPGGGVDGDEPPSPPDQPPVGPPPPGPRPPGRPPRPPRRGEI